MALNSGDKFVIVREEPSGSPLGVSQVKYTVSQNDVLNKVINNLPPSGGGGGGASIYASSSAPVAPEIGDLWFDRANGRIRIYRASRVWEDVYNNTSEYKIKITSFTKVS